MSKKNRTKQNIKPIQGRQLPNDVQPECIRTIKVYDWVILTNRDRNKVPIPEDCFAEIEACRAAGSIVSAECELVEDSTSCNVISSQDANIEGIPSAQIVTLGFHAQIQVTFFCDDDELCSFTVPVSFVDDVILCYPDGTEINCDIFDVQCNVVMDYMFGNMVMLDVIMCKDVQVEAEVKLEVEAKFCGPRRPIPVPDVPIECPFPTFPQQCPEFFPPENCECQGGASLFNSEETIFVNASGTLSPVTGNLTLNTTICDQCTLAGSTLTASFVDFPQVDPSPEDIIDQSFSFIATQFDYPTCDDDTLTVTGVGTFTLAGQLPQNANFTLILDDSDESVELTITAQGGGTLAVIDVDEADVTVRNCVRFDD
ncbi:hypothetical protein PQ478_12590 [Alkalihalophilus pseudofirmus]|uniref:hypothetical protein n=1 Tax=Alkalihalophilus pseudofirmus TaxID=79885 RepID=UPI00259BC120|nr:hypothetical protein [Alkalihalophilus pseudofirmus]WEG15377.1 hypothetical protein PQ478_12590 [Alkalihalophilus pseudofirmus]